MNKKAFILPAAVIAMLMLASVPLQAQPPPPIGPAAGPIDGGIFAFVLAMVTYGYRKLSNEEAATENTAVTK